jgi:LacI family transcriptional regulator
LSAVAARAGVSIAIASRVSNGLSVGMTPETRARVEAAILALGYRPNRVARSLRTSRHYRIALLAVDTSPAYLADPFNTYVAAGISNTLSDAGYGLLLERLDPRSPNELLIERAQESDGLAVYLSGGRRSSMR